jgi:hypothetical protein
MLPYGNGILVGCVGTYRLELEYTKATFKTVKFEFQNFKYFRAIHTVFRSCVILIEESHLSKCYYFLVGR